MAVIDSYSESNAQADDKFLLVAFSFMGQSFTGSSATLDSAKFYIDRVGSPTGNAVAKVYAHSGTYGTSSVPSTLLATSDNVDVSTISTTTALVTFTFSGANRISLTATNYVVTVEYSGGDASNRINVWFTFSGASHSGNRTDSGGASATQDTVFYVLGADPGLAITTNAVSSITKTTATGNGNITNVTSGNADERGIVYSTSTQAAPGNVAPGSSGYSNAVTETGSFSTGAFTKSMTGLSPATRYYIRAYAHNATDGYIYGSEVNFITGLEVAWFRA